MPRPIRVLYVSDSLEVGGAERYLAALLRRLPRDRFRPAAAAPPGPALDLLSGLVPARALPRVTTLRRPLAFLGLLAFFLRSRARLIHFNLVDSWSCAAAILAARIASGARLVATAHLPTTPLPGRFPLRARLAPGLLDRVIALSEEHRPILVNRDRVPPGRIRVVPNGVDLARFGAPGERGAARRALGLPEGVPLVVTVGRMTDQKRTSLLLRAVARARCSGAELGVALVGDGPLRPRLERQARRLGLAGHAWFLGERDDVPQALAAADFFALSSRFEGHPLSLLEAMAAGLPCVAPELPGMRDLVVPEETGLLFPSGDARALAMALLELLRAPSEAARLGAAGRKRAEALGSEAQMADRTFAVYRELFP